MARSAACDSSRRSGSAGEDVGCRFMRSDYPSRDLQIWKEIAFLKLHLTERRGGYNSACKTQCLHDLPKNSGCAGPRRSACIFRDWVRHLPAFAMQPKGGVSSSVSPKTRGRSCSSAISLPISSARYPSTPPRICTEQRSAQQLRFRLPLQPLAAKHAEPARRLQQASRR
jgi:hypothetical protein